MLLKLKKFFLSFLPMIKRFPYAFGLIVYLSVVESVQIVLGPFDIFNFLDDGTQVPYFRLDLLKTLGFIFLVGTIGIRIAFEQLIGREDIKLPFKLKKYYDHVASGILALLLIIFGVLVYVAPSPLLTLEIGLLWLVVVLFLPFAPFILGGVKIPEYLLYLTTRVIILGFFIAFLAGVIPNALNIIITIVARIPLGLLDSTITRIIELIVTYGFGIPYFITQLPKNGVYEKDTNKEHPFFSFMYGTIVPIGLFIGLITTFGGLAAASFGLETLQESVDPEFRTLVTNGVISVLVLPMLVIGHFALVNTSVLKNTRALSKLFHYVFPFVAPILTLVLFSETLRTFFTPLVWELSPLILLNLVFTAASGYLSFIYFKNKRILPVRAYYLTLIGAFVLLMLFFPFTDLSSLRLINDFFYGTGLIA
jgi:hypothetical protein